MSARPHDRVVAALAGAGTGVRDAGYSLVEVLVSLALITVTMAAFTTFVLTSVKSTGGQSTQQSALQVAEGAIDQLRAVDATAVVTGRDEVSTKSQWAAGLAIPGIAKYLTHMTWVWDSAAVYPAGATATVPTTPTVATISGVAYTRSWYVGHCWRPPGADASCDTTVVAGATEFVRVIAGVTWSDNNCPNGLCAYAASTLISTPVPDPVFDLAPPVVPPPPVSTGPAGGSVDATGLTGTGSRYSSSTTLHLALAKGTAAVGLAATGARLYRATASLSSSGGVANGSCGTYGTYAKVGADDPAATLDDTVTDQACYRYRYVVADTFGVPATYTSGDIKVDTTAADTTPVLTLTAGPNTAVSGGVLYFRPAASSGSFTLTAAATDLGSGIASYAFPALGTGWTSVPGALGTVTYSWSAINPLEPVGPMSVTALNNAGVVSAASGFTVVAESTGPTGGSVDATGLAGTGSRYATATALSIALAKGTDVNGVALTGASLQRLTASLTSAGGTANGVCGGFAAAVTVATDPGTPVANTVTDQACYQYQYTVSDSLGNLSTYVSGDVKVDSTAPAAPGLVFSAMTNSVAIAGTVYLTAASGSFTVTASATDAGSGIASYAFPDLGVGWTGTPGATGVMTYSWTGGVPAPASGLAVTATNNAGLVSPSATFSTVVDTTGPTGGSVAVSGLVGTGSLYAAGTSLSVVLSKGTDTNGLGAGLLYRATATLTSAGGTSDGVCGGFGSYVLVPGGSDPASPKAETVTDQACYRYQYVVADSVGNQSTYTSGDVKVDTTAAAAPGLTLTAGTNTYVSGGVVYFRQPASSGSFTVTAAATDGASGIASYSFPALGTGWTSVPGVLGTVTYSWSAINPAQPGGAVNVTALNNAAVVSAASAFTVVADSTAPTGGSVDATGLTGTGSRYAASTGLSIALTKGTDAHGVAATGALLRRLTAPLTSAGGTANGACGTYGSAVTVATDPSTPVADTVADQACYQYQYTVSDNLGNATTYSSGDVKVDRTAPSTPTLAFSAMTNSNVSTGTVYLTGTSGSFTITATATDTASGIASYAFPNLGAGWTATPGVTGVMTYSWTGGAPAPASGLAVTATNNAGLVSTAGTFNTDTDTGGPTGGSVAASGLAGTGSLYSTSTSLSIVLNKGTDTNGLGAGLLYRATATLTSAGSTANGVCGTFGSYVLVPGGSNPASPKAETVTDQACYRYQYVVADNLGNQTTYTSTDIKVDTTAAATPGLTLTAGTNTYVSGTTVYYGSSAASGSFSVTASSTDAASGIVSYGLPTLGTGWTGTPGGTGVMTYSWASAGPAAPGAKSVTATDNAALVSAGATFTPTADVSLPTGGSVSYTNGYTSSLSVAVTFAAGSDTGSGLDATTGILQRASATVTAGVCDAVGAFATISTNPASPYTDRSVANNACYQYRYLISDRVGNQATYTSVSVAHIDYAGAVNATTGAVSHWRLDEGATIDSFTGTASTNLAAHPDNTGQTWTQHSIHAGTIVITDANRIRKNGTQDAAFYSSAQPSSPDYGVEADVIVKSSLSGDSAGVEGRMVDIGHFYFAHYNKDGTNWALMKTVNGVETQLGTYVQTLTVGTSYRLRLEFVGTTIKVYIDGVARITVTDASITGAGHAGVRFGSSSTSTSPSNTAGIHLDNFALTQPAIDSVGTNDGTFMSAPALGQPGAISNDGNTAMKLDGTSEYVTVPDANSLDLTDGPLSIEAWIKRADNATGTQTILQKGTGTYQLALKNNTVGLYKYGTATAIAQANGTLLDTTGFHHIVATKTGATTKIYIDGVDVTTAGTNATLVNTATALTIGGSSSEWFNGTLDEVAIYNQILSAGTVADHYLLGAGADLAGPTGGTVDATGLTGTGSRYSTSTNLSVAFTPGTDVSGLAGTGRKLSRATATLTAGTCGSYGSYVQVGADDPTTPKADTVTDQACYSYKYLVADQLGNATTYTSGDIKVDSTAPAAPGLTLSPVTNTYATGSTVYYKSNASSGSFTATGAGTDTGSGIASYTFGSAGAGWSISGSGTSRTYSWASTSPTTSNPAITATNNAGGVSTGSTVTMTADTSVPTGGAISYTNGSASSPNLAITLTTGTDTGSGLNTAGALLQRATATYYGGSCGTYSAFATIATGPTSPYTDTGLASGCFKYQYVMTDNVGNTTTYTSANTVQIDYSTIIQGTTGLASYWRMGVAPTVADSFTDTAGTLLENHTGEIGADWTLYGGTATILISNAGRIRRGTSNSAVLDYVSSAPVSANYAAEADLTKLSAMSDAVGIEARRNPTAGSGQGYDWHYDGQANQWQLLRISSGNATVLDSLNQTLTVGRTYRIRLDLNGTAIKGYVDGVLICSATDSGISAAGRGAIQLNGASGSTTDTTGYHVDNFRVVTNTGTTMTATVGSNGTFAGSPLLNTIGATDDLNSSTQWTAGTSYSDVPDSAALDLGDGPFSLEAWIRRNDNGTGMQTIMQKGTGAYQFGFYNNKIGLYKYTGSGVGTVIAQSVATQLDTTTFHHYVATKNGAAVKIYVDGTDVTGTVTNSTLTNTASVLRLGGGSASEFLNGYSDEVAVYNQVLTPTTVNDHYLAGNGGSGVAAALGIATATAETTPFTTGIQTTGPVAVPVKRHPRSPRRPRRKGRR